MFVDSVVIKSHLSYCVKIEFKTFTLSTDKCSDACFSSSSLVGGLFSCCTFGDIGDRALLMCVPNFALFGMGSVLVSSSSTSLARKPSAIEIVVRDSHLEHRHDVFAQHTGELCYLLPNPLALNCCFFTYHHGRRKRGGQGAWPPTLLLSKIFFKVM